MKEKTLGQILLLLLLAIAWSLIQYHKGHVEAYQKLHYNSLSSSEKTLVDFALITKFY